MSATTNRLFTLEDPKLISAIDEVPLWSAPFGLELLEKVNYKKNLQVLDIGSGLGFPMIELAMRLGRSSRVIGIELWSGAVQRIKEKIELSEIKNAEIINGNAENLPFKNDFFDLIISNNGINNVEDLDKVLSEAYRVAKKGSQILFSFNLSQTMYEFYDAFIEVLTEFDQIESIENIEKHIFTKRKPIEYMKDRIVESGFHVKDISYHSFNIKFADWDSMYDHFLIKLAFKESWKEIVDENYQKKVFSRLKEKLDICASRQGYLNFTVPFVLLEAGKD